MAKKKAVKITGKKESPAVQVGFKLGQDLYAKLETLAEEADFESTSLFAKHLIVRVLGGEELEPQASPKEATASSSEVLDAVKNFGEVLSNFSEETAQALDQVLREVTRQEKEGAHIEAELVRLRKQMGAVLVNVLVMFAKKDGQKLTKQDAVTLVDAALKDNSQS